MMLVLLASCGSAHRRGSATAQSVSRTPSYAKPRVYVVGRAHRSQAAHGAQSAQAVHGAQATHRPPAARHVHRHPNAAPDASSAPLTHTFPLGTQAICCRASSATG
jgi:hypothetical protein